MINNARFINEKNGPNAAAGAGAGIAGPANSCAGVKKIVLKARGVSATALAADPANRKRQKCLPEIATPRGAGGWPKTVTAGGAA